MAPLKLRQDLRRRTRPRRTKHDARTGFDRRLQRGIAHLGRVVGVAVVEDRRDTVVDRVETAGELADFDFGGGEVGLDVPGIEKEGVRECW